MPTRPDSSSSLVSTFLTNARRFATYLAPLRDAEWVVYSKRPFGGSREVLRYLARYTLRVAIGRRIVALDDKGVTFKRKDCRIDGSERYQTMTLDTRDFVPWRFSAAGCLGVSIDHHPGGRKPADCGRKPAHFRTLAKRRAMAQPLSL